MIVFAWILWSYLLFSFVVGVIIIVIANIKELHYKIEIEDFIVKIALFIFMCLYIFG